MRVLEPYQQIERTIMTKYRKEIWNPLCLAVKSYRLISEGDKIAVCISGGKDSMLMALCLRLLQKYGGVPFDLTYLVMDPGYNAANRKQIEDNAKLLNIPITVFTSSIFEVANGAGGSPCYLCARMRRGALYAKAKELGCNKIAVGHHFNDVIETTLMGMLYGAQIQGMMPKLHSTNFEGMELIRPLYCVHEDSIIAWRNYNNLTFLQCACRFTEEAEKAGNNGSTSKRQEMKLLIKELKKKNPDVEKSIFRSLHAVCLDTFPTYKSKGETHSFLDRYDDIKE